MESLMNALERQKISLPIANTKTMLLYPDFLQPLAVKLANEHRSKGMDVALVCFARDKVLADYEEYGRKEPVRRHCLYSEERFGACYRFVDRRSTAGGAVGEEGYEKDEIFDHCTDKRTPGVPDAGAAGKSRHHLR